MTPGFQGTDDGGAVSALIDRLNAGLERYLPEKRLFLRSDTTTRFVRLRPTAQAVILGGAVAYAAWSLIATSILFFGLIGSTDHHSAFPGSHGFGRVAVWAESLSREAIWQAIRARRTYALTGDRIEVMLNRRDGVAGEPSLRRAGPARIEADE